MMACFSSYCLDSGFLAASVSGQSILRPVAIRQRRLRGLACPSTYCAQRSARGRQSILDCKRAYHGAKRTSAGRRGRGSCLARQRHLSENILTTCGICKEPKDEWQDQGMLLAAQDLHLNMDKICRSFIDFFSAKGHAVARPVSSVTENTNLLEVRLLHAEGSLMDQAFGGGKTAALALELAHRAEVSGAGPAATYHRGFQLPDNFADYYCSKVEAFQLAWELLTSVYRLPVDHLWVSVHTEDEAASAIWKDEVGVSPERVQSAVPAVGDSRSPGSVHSAIHYNLHPEQGLALELAWEGGQRQRSFQRLVSFQANDCAGAGARAYPPGSSSTGVSIRMNVDSVAHILKKAACTGGIHRGRQQVVKALSWTGKSRSFGGAAAQEEERSRANGVGRNAGLPDVGVREESGEVGARGESGEVGARGESVGGAQSHSDVEDRIAGTRLPQPPWSRGEGRGGAAGAGACGDGGGGGGGAGEGGGGGCERTAEDGRGGGHRKVDGEKHGRGGIAESRSTSSALTGLVEEEERAQAWWRWPRSSEDSAVAGVEGRGLGGLDPLRAPRHVAIIMDGNSRWAQARGLHPQAGHRAGVAALQEIVRLSWRWGVRALTVFAFSAENWRRPKSEVEYLLKLFETELVAQTNELHREGVQVRFVGNLGRLPLSLQLVIRGVHSLTAGNKGLALTVAVSYGARDEIVEACRALVRAGVPADDVTEEALDATMRAHNQVGDPDLLIRTSGEQRLSNFLLWQLAYTELYFSDVLWPDFKEDAYRAALLAYQERDRRFGRRKEQAG